MMSSLASVLVAKAKATPEKVVPWWGQMFSLGGQVQPLTKSMPTMSWALERPSPAASAMLFGLLYVWGGPWPWGAGGPPP